MLTYAQAKCIFIIKYKMLSMVFSTRIQMTKLQQPCSFYFSFAKAIAVKEKNSTHFSA